MQVPWRPENAVILVYIFDVSDLAALETLLQRNHAANGANESQTRAPLFLGFLVAAWGGRILWASQARDLGSLRRWRQED